MTSSTSLSDAAASARLRRWATIFAVTFFGGAALLYAVLILVDPYDSGRFPSIPVKGISDRTLRTADVSRARDKQFDSAVFGSSTGMAIDPTRLSEGTGLHFVQLAFSHGNPPEILSMLTWYLRHHTAPGAVVMIADDLWCSADPTLPPRYPFPYWLYGSDAEYLAAVLNWKSLDRVVWRLSIAFGRRKPDDPKGYFGFHFDGPFQESPQIPTEISAAQSAASFVWIDRLSRVLNGAVPSMSVIVVFPPAVAEYLPPPDSRLADRLGRCKSALQSLVVRGPRGGLIDERVDRPELHDRANFYDRLHYRAPLARRIENRVIETLTAQPSSRLAADAAGGVTR